MDPVDDISTSLGERGMLINLNQYFEKCVKDNVTISIHNADFDIPMLRSKLKQYDLPTDFIDTLESTDKIVDSLKLLREKDGFISLNRTSKKSIKSVMSSYASRIPVENFEAKWLDSNLGKIKDSFDILFTNFEKNE